MSINCLLLSIILYGCGHHRNLPLLTHTFPTRRSSELFLYEAMQTLNATDEAAALTRFDELLVAHAAHSFGNASRSEEHTSELQSLMSISYAVFCLKKKKIH